MKNKTHTPPAPIMCNLMNGADKHPIHAMMFAIINVMLTKYDPLVINYFAELNYFTIQQYMLFSKRILDKRNVEVPVNQVHFIIFYSILHFIVQLQQSGKMSELLRSELPPEQAKKVEESGLFFITFCNNALEELRKDYKNNHNLLVALAKIKA